MAKAGTNAERLLRAMRGRAAYLVMLDGCGQAAVRDAEALGLVISEYRGRPKQLYVMPTARGLKYLRSLHDAVYYRSYCDRTAAGCCPLCMSWPEITNEGVRCRHKGCAIDHQLMARESWETLSTLGHIMRSSRSAQSEIQRLVLQLLPVLRKHENHGTDD